MDIGLSKDLSQRQSVRPSRFGPSWRPLAVRARHAVGPAVEWLAFHMLWGPAVEPIPIAYPPGHHHSPLPARRDIEQARQQEVVGIDLRRDQQVAALAELNLQPPTGPRYDAPDNGWFSPVDAAVYQAIIRRYQPARVIEVGCGWSTAALFDAGAAPHVTLIDPHLERLREVLTSDDLSRCTVFEATLQSVPLSVFQGLGPGDVLFIDSTHVTKCGSDVNRAVFEILPALAPGVLIHFHDIFYPFEYPDAWVREGRGWNEAYLLRAFLEYNGAFEIIMWNSMLQAMGHLTGDCGSVWLQKVGEPEGQASSR